MLGEHPQMYGLPEVNLFVAETMRERQGVIARPKFSEHGLLRAVAQLFAGEQTFGTIALARRWVEMRANCTCSSVLQELGERVAPRILVEKSPRSVVRCEYLQRIWKAFPNTKFLHLLRHPRSLGESLYRLGGTVAAKGLEALDYSTDPPAVDFQKAWYSLNMNIITFLDGIPEDQKIQVRGEELLGDVDTYLRRIVKWLGLRTDEEAIEAMRHPEWSPYADFGPANARFGNDPNFLSAPALRPLPSGEAPSLEGPLSWRQDGRGFSPEVVELAKQLGYS